MSLNKSHKPPKYPKRLLEAQEHVDLGLTTYLGVPTLPEGYATSQLAPEDIRARMGQPTFAWTKDEWPDEKIERKRRVFGPSEDFEEGYRTAMKNKER